jgi:hypothetical protein
VCVCVGVCESVGVCGCMCVSVWVGECVCGWVCECGCVRVRPSLSVIRFNNNPLQVNRV